MPSLQRHCVGNIFSINDKKWSKKLVRKATSEAIIIRWLGMHEAPYDLPSCLYTIRKALIAAIESKMFTKYAQFRARITQRLHIRWNEIC